MICVGAYWPFAMHWLEVRIYEPVICPNCGPLPISYYPEHCPRCNR